MAYEWYVLDENLHRSQVIEGFESFIWTERYSAWGDFQIVTKTTDAAKILLAVDTLIVFNQSNYVMKVETITDAEDDTGVQNLTITGRSLEAILDDRIAMTPEMMDDIVTNPKWVITNTPGNVARTIFQTICVELAVNTADAIPFYAGGRLLPPGSIPETDEVITAAIDPMTVYSAIKQTCDTYGLGFRIIRNGEMSELYFEVYTGDDRTSAQTVRDAVIFSPAMDNLANTKKLTSKASYKNVAYVVGKDEIAIVYGVGEDPEADGFNRRVLIVDASSIDASNVDDVGAALAQKGLAELAAHQKVYQFDGEISQYGVFQYGRDYKLGDLVEERDQTGYGNEMRVTEQIFVSDKEGDRSYPTLSLTLVIVPGTWSAWTPPDQDWAAVSSDKVWGNQ
jgi:hypothetical protein